MFDRSLLAVYLVTDSGLCEAAGRSVPQTVADAVAGGVTLVQYRRKGVEVSVMLKELSEIVDAAAGVPVLVNDHVDLYQSAVSSGLRVAGMHVGQGDAPVSDVREVVGHGIVGLTTSTPEAASEPGVAEFADYVGTGPFRPTSTKDAGRPPLGESGLKSVVDAASVPVVAIGGLTVRDVPAVARSGAAGMAVVSAICSAESVTHAARALRDEWDSYAKDDRGDRS